MRKLEQSKIKRIISLRHEGKSQNEIANILGINQWTVWKYDPFKTGRGYRTDARGSYGKQSIHS